MNNQINPNKSNFLRLIFIMLLAVACNKQPIVDTQWQLLASGFNFPEGPAWDANGTLYVSNCNGNWLAKIKDGIPDTLVTVSDTTIKQTNGLLVLPSRDILACDYGLGAILEISPEGKVKTLLSGYENRPFNRPNDLTIAPDGRLYFSDPKSYGSEKLDGRLFMYDFESGLLHLIADSLAFPNGLEVSPLDGKLYLSESAKNRVLSFVITDSGTVSDKKTFVELPGGDPDGLEFDDKGNLYVAHFGSGTVFIISPDGQILQKLQAPGTKPSNIEFGGEDFRTLFLTEDETNSVYYINTQFAGSRF